MQSEYLEDDRFFEKMVDLIEELVQGDYQTMVTEGRLAGTPHVIDAYIKRFPGTPMMPPVSYLRQIRGFWEITAPDEQKRSWMVAVNLWFRHKGNVEQGDLIAELVYTENDDRSLKAQIYNLVS